ncbi:hypothetical protein BDR22DRAFT_858945 [Usnea florida]
MAEVVAAASSVIAIIQITDRIVGLCKYYIETVKDVASDLRLILVEVSALKPIFENLDFLMTHNCAVSTAVSILSGKDGAIEGCRRSITELEKLFPSDWKQTAGQNTSRKQRVKATWAALAWPLKENRARKLLDEITRYKTTITLAITTDSVQDIKDIRTKSTEMHRILNDNQRQEVYKWLEHTDPSPLHHVAQNLYEPGTGNWMLRSPEWTAWLRAKHRCLWINGIPGAGKTVLMSYLITQVKQHCDQLQDGKAACVYYYCYHGHGQDETLPFLRWLVNQLCRRANVVPGSVYKMYKYGGEPSLVELLNALEEVLQKFEAAYVIVDAIDESNPREDLLKVFRDLATDLRFAKIQLLASSREYIDIERVMQDFSVSLSMANNFVQEDIRIHVRHRLESNPKLTRWPQDLLDEVEEAVSTGARGMFRWAVCQLDAIQRLKGDRHVVQKALKNLPKTLDETYDRVLLKVPEEDHQFVHHTLQLILHHNNLYGGDFDGGIPYAVLVRGVERSVAGLNSNQNDRFYDYETVRELCGCLITVTPERSRFNYALAKIHDGKVTPQRHNALTVSFAHYTVHEYLRSNRISKSSTAYVASFKEDLEQHFMEMIFAESLQIKTNERRHWSVAESYQRGVVEELERYFMAYCVVSAVCSLRGWSAQISRHNTLSDLAIDLLDPCKAHFSFLVSVAEELTWLEFGLNKTHVNWKLSWPSEPSNTDAAHLTTLLRQARAKPACLSLAERFLQSKNNKDFLTTRLTFSDNAYKFDGSIVEVFAQLAFGASGVFRLLLDNGTGLFDPSKILLLFIGCHQDHPNHDCSNYCLLERLLDLGADPNMDWCWVSPLQIAVQCCDLTAISILLEAGADPNPVENSDGVAWQRDTLPSRFNRLRGASPLYIHRHFDPWKEGDIMFWTEETLDARQGYSDRIEATLLKYGAKSYLRTEKGTHGEKLGVQRNSTQHSRSQQTL